jgi:hypothetical protein
MRIKVTETNVTPPYTNVTYLYRRDNGTWGCLGKNGVPLALWYAGIEHEAECRFALMDAPTLEHALAVVRAYCRNPTRYTYEPVQFRSIATT